MDKTVILKVRERVSMVEYIDGPDNMTAVLIDGCQVAIVGTGSVNDPRRSTIGDGLSHTETNDEQDERDAERLRGAVCPTCGESVAMHSELELQRCTADAEAISAATNRIKRAGLI